MKKLLVILLVFSLKPLLSAQKAPQLGKNPIKEVIAAMTREEKINLVVGMGMNIPGMPQLSNNNGSGFGQTMDKVPGAAGTTFAIPRLNIPSIVVADGPAGLRIQPTRDENKSQTFYCTAFPVATLLASSWDVDLVRQAGAAMGNEVKEYGVDILLGPALNIHRNALGGRNFEYYSEDPVVSGAMATAMVKGIQSNGVGTSIKHFAVNNHETNRNQMNVKISERALREIYLKGFETVVKNSKPWTVMSSYNKINGTYTSESKELLGSVLRDDWKYKGFVMTDWFGGSDAVAQMKAGNDLLMPGTGKQKEQLTAALKDASLSEQVLDENITRILNIILETSSFKGYKFTNKPDLKKHAQVARAIATEGMILLKNNNNTLPLKKNSSLAVFGKASYEFISGGTGSGDVNEAYTISLTEGLTKAGFKINTTLKNNYEKYVKEERAKQPTSPMWFLGKPPIDEKVLSNEELASVNDAQVAIITIGRNSGEFSDRKKEIDFDISANEMALLKTVATDFHQKGKKVIVILNIGGQIDVSSWNEYADAILLAWEPGQEAGNAVADILSGKVNPSGKLATTFPVRHEDEASTKGFPGIVLEAADPKDPMAIMKGNKAEITYEDGIFVGYRYYNTFGVKPAYEFGYGLSYTDFAYSNLKLNKNNFNGSITATVTVTNKGKVAGKEVVQLYVSAPSSTLQKPESELRNFAKTRLLKVGESQTLTFTLQARDLSSFDSEKSAWVVDAGKYTVKIGASSKNIRHSSTFNVANEILVEKVNKVLLPSAAITELKK
jgi:beta-glucosidase